MLVWLLNTPNLTGLVICGLLISYLIKICGSNKQITFDRQQFEITHQIFGGTYLRQTGKNSEVFGTFIYNKIFQGNQIRIHSGNAQVPKFYVAENLQDMEAAWLAQEIQDWLHLR